MSSNIKTNEEEEVEETNEETNEEAQTGQVPVSGSMGTVSPEIESGRQFEMTVRHDGLEWLFDTISVSAEECHLTVAHGSLWVSVIGPANVLMNASRYDPDPEMGEIVNGPSHIGVRVDQLLDVLKTAKGMVESSGGMVTLELDDGRLNITAGGFSYELAVLDPDVIRSTQDVDEIRKSAQARCEPHIEDVRTGVEAAELASSYVTVSIDESGFEMSTRGDIDKTEVRVNQSTRVDEPAESKFSTDYLTQIASAWPKDGDVTLAVGTEMPMFIDYTALDGRGRVTWVLAPRRDK